MADNHSKKDGGPAFPHQKEDGSPYWGMTLRDWFAGQVLASVSAQTIRAFFDDGMSGEDTTKAIVGQVFAIADAMIAARGGQ